VRGKKKAETKRMGKSLKLRFSRVIASFNSCRSKNPSSLPQNPNFFPHKLTSTKHISPDFPLIDQNQNQNHRNYVPESTMISVGCCRSEFKWEKEEKFHVVSSSFVSEEEECEEEINLALRPPLTPPRFSRIVVEKKKKKQQRVKKTKTKSRIIRMSTSSADEYSGILSGTNTDWDNNEEETESLVSSSRSCYDFSSDDSSTDFNPHLETICETTTMRRRHKRNANTKRRSIKQSRPSFSSSKGRRSSVSTSSDSELPARLSVFKKLIPCSVDGKVKESFAIVKKSQDPY
uniref:Uncharacterized protein n=1 Tax=Solanum lycopersicum TaxID=4081 RepID=A0A3Q7F7J4_SOLLC